MKANIWSVNSLISLVILTGSDFLNRIGFGYVISSMLPFFMVWGEISSPLWLIFFQAECKGCGSEHCSGGRETYRAASPLTQHRKAAAPASVTEQHPRLMRNPARRLSRLE